MTTSPWAARTAANTAELLREQDQPAAGDGATKSDHTPVAA